MNGRDRRFRERLDGAHCADRLLQVGALVAGPGQLAEALDVAAHREAAAGAVEDEHPYPIVLLGPVENFTKLVPEPAGHGVQLVRPIQGRPADRPIDAIGQHGGRLYCFHGLSSTERLVGRGGAAGKHPYRRFRDRLHGCVEQFDHVAVGIRHVDHLRPSPALDAVEQAPPRHARRARAPRRRSPPGDRSAAADLRRAAPSRAATSMKLNSSTVTELIRIRHIA